MAKNACVTAVAASAVAAGLVTGSTAMNADVPQEISSPSVGLAATTLPIININETVGPLAITRALVASYDSIDTGAFIGSRASLDGEGTTAWTPATGPIVALSRELHVPLAIITIPAQFTTNVLFQPARGHELDLNPLGTNSLVAAGSLESFSDITRYLGGPQGSGVGATGYLLRKSNDSALIIGDLQVGSQSRAVVGSYSNRFTVMPGRDGLVATADFFPVQGGGFLLAQTSQDSVAIQAQAQIGGGVTFCPGAGAGLCGGNIAGAAMVASGGLEIYRNQTPLFDLDAPNEVSALLTSDELAVVGSVGATVQVGSKTLGRVVPIDVHIERPTLSASAASSARQSQTTAIRNSVKAEPRKSATAKQSTTGTSERRTPVRDAANSVKTAVKKAVKKPAATAAAED